MGSMATATLCLALFAVPAGAYVYDKHKNYIMRYSNSELITQLTCQCTRCPCGGRSQVILDGPQIGDIIDLVKKVENGANVEPRLLTGTTGKAGDHHEEFDVKPKFCNGGKLIRKDVDGTWVVEMKRSISHRERDRLSPPVFTLSGLTHNDFQFRDRPSAHRRLSANPKRTT